MLLSGQKENLYPLILRFAVPHLFGSFSLMIAWPRRSFDAEYACNSGHLVAMPSIAIRGVGCAESKDEIVGQVQYLAYSLVKTLSVERMLLVMKVHNNLPMMIARLIVQWWSTAKTVQ